MNIKIILFIFTGLLLLAPLSSFALKATVAEGFSDVSVSEAKVMIDSKPFLVLLDVRNQSEYDTGHIQNAILIPVWQLTARLNELNASDEILVYCKSGGRSANASQILVDNNFTHVYNMLGGITNWITAGYPVYVKYPSIQEAINNATDGDTVYVSEGVYNECLSVNRSITLVGENANTTIINGTATVLTVNANNVSVSDFTVQYVGCACYGYIAVSVAGGQNVNVTNNVIVSDDFGIFLAGTRNVIVADNNITHTGDAAIVVSNSSETSVFENSIVASDGIETDQCTASNFSGNNIISSRGAGLFTSDSYDNTFSHNTIFSNVSTGLSISTSDNNTFFGNTISAYGTYGLFFWQSNNNSFFNNNFLGSTGLVQNYGSTSFWDNGFEGNYWSNYTEVDANLDGIGDTPYFLDSTDRDNYPLMGMFQTFNASLTYEVNIVSNSTINEFQYLEPNRTIELRVSNTTTDQKTGFCRISVPHGLIDPHDGPLTVVIDNGQTPVLFLNNSVHDDGTCRWIYFTYPQSTHEILVVPEFPMLLMLCLFMITTVIATATCKRRHSKAR